MGKAIKAENMHCASCGMLVEPAMAFHPHLYCQLFKAGILDPAGFLEGQRFIPDPAHWGKDAPKHQREAASARSSIPSIGKPTGRAHSA